MPWPGQVIGERYTLKQRLGAGGMGFVFEAEQMGVGNRVAIKFLDPEPAQDDSRVQRFLQEAKVALTVAHPGATALLDVGKDDKLNMMYLVFEYVEGEDLRAVLKREGRLSFAEARDITLKVAEVLAFAHQRGVVHRDVKPENLRLRRGLSGTHVKVLDFGIARLVQAQGVRLTGEGQIAGTPRYMAPEQVIDQPIDARTDVYALGLVVWEMLSGRPAFDGRNLAHVMWQQMNEPLPALSTVVEGAPSEAIDGFLTRATAKKPDQRFRSMEALVFALKGLGGEGWPDPGGATVRGALPGDSGSENPTAVESALAPKKATDSGTPAPPPPKPSKAVPAAKREPEKPPAPPPAVKPVNQDLLATVKGLEPAKPETPVPAPPKRRAKWPWLVLLFIALVAATALLVRYAMGARMRVGFVPVSGDRHTGAHALDTSSSGGRGARRV